MEGGRRLSKCRRFLKLHRKFSLESLHPIVSFAPSSSFPPKQTIPKNNMRRQHSPPVPVTGFAVTVPFSNTSATGIRPPGTPFISNNVYRNPPYSSSSSSSLTSTHWINVDGRSILTTVTSDPRVIDDWIGGVMSKTYRRGLVVGLDCEWKPNFIRGQNNNKVSILQLCVGSKCLIVQLLYLNYSRSLTRFLMHPSIVFVGVGIQADADKICQDYGIEVGPQRYELRELAYSTMVRDDLRYMGLKTLARLVIGMEISKPRSITLSNWSEAHLTERQIEYACVDAYASFAIGMRLLGRRF